MKKYFRNAVIGFSLLLVPILTLGQTPPPLGDVAGFVLFSSDAAVTHTQVAGVTQITGDVGTNGASVTGFVNNINGKELSGTPETILAAPALQSAFNDLGLQGPATTLGIGLGSGQILTPGIYSVPSASTLNGILTLDGQNLIEPYFLIKLTGAFASGANAEVKLINGAKACNVFWRIDGGATSLASGTLFKGNILANAAIDLAIGTVLEGRALTTSGAVSVSGKITASLPIGCGSPVFTGPLAPEVGATECFALFTSIGAVTNTGTSNVTGDVGTNSQVVGANWSTNPAQVNGNIYDMSPVNTQPAATDLTTLNNYLTGLSLSSNTIELLHPTLLGFSQVLTPNIYLLGAATHLTDTLFLDARGIDTAIFVIHIKGAFTTAANSKIILLDGAQSKNVFWKMDLEASVATGSTFRGSIISNGAIVLNEDTLDGRALTTNGAVTTDAVFMIIPTAIGSAGTVMGSDTICQGQTGVIYSVSAINNATSYIWTLPSGATITAGANTNSITVDFSPTATSGTWNITVQGSSNCGSGTVSSNFEVIVIETPTVNNVNNQSICNNDTTSTIVFSGGSAGTTYSWTNDNTSIGLAGSGNGDIDSFTGINNGTSSETATITITPSTNGCFGASTSFTITVNQMPTMNSTSDQSICNNDATSTIVFSGGSAGTIYNWTNDNTSIGLAASGNGDINSFTGINNGTGSDTATITIIPSMNSCSGDSTSFTITVNQTPTMNSISDQSICNNDTTSTIVFSGGSVANTYNWTNDNTSIGLAANGNGDINSFTAINTGTNPVSATITVTPTLNGCEGTPSTATIEVNNCIDVDFNIPEGFSPNGDEINDLFVIRGIDRFPGNSFVIFNRWGDKLFEANPYKNTWNGKSTTGLRVGGDELPVGTYFYILDLDEGSAIYKGTIYLNR